MTYFHITPYKNLPTPKLPNCRHAAVFMLALQHRTLLLVYPAMLQVKFKHIVINNTCTIILFLIFVLCSHTIHSNVWTSFHLLHLQNNKSTTILPITISEAVHQWLVGARRDPRFFLQLQDYCQGAHCNPDCPEQVVLGGTSSHWPLWCQATILATVIAITFVGVVIKIWLSIWDCVNRRHRKLFLKMTRPYFISDSSSSVCMESRFLRNK